MNLVASPAETSATLLTVPPVTLPATVPIYTSFVVSLKSLSGHKSALPLL